MSKTWIIIKREYISRVAKKSFLLSTFLTPILFVGLIFGVAYLTATSSTDEKVAVDNKESYLKEYLVKKKNISYEFVDNADTTLLSKGYTAVLLAPNTGINQTKSYQVYSQKSKGNDLTGPIEKQINTAINAKMVMDVGGLSKAEYDSLMKNAPTASVENTVFTEAEKAKKSNFEVASMIGYAVSFIIYFSLFMYGAAVMRGVMEEKTNRIAEVMVSSVKPFQLMMGKIIGIGAVGLTQFIMWIILFVGLSTIATNLMPMDPAAMQDATAAMQPGMSAAAVEASQNKAAVFLNTVSTSVNWPLIIGCFIFYYIGGYLFYAALFAAVGSAVNEDPQDAQSLMMPITIPIILSMVIMVNAIRQPESSLAIWGSMIPFSSPIIMMARLPFGSAIVPWWQLALSMLILILGFIATIWLSAKIYRTGILMYGKKVTLKELGKWAFRKN